VVDALQMSVARGQRVVEAAAGGGRTGLGGSPTTIGRRARVIAPRVRDRDVTEQRR